MSTVVKDAEMEDLFEKNQRLVYYIISRRYSSFLSDEDIVQSGMLGLWKACRVFDCSKARFATFALKCIDNEIKMEFRRRKHLTPEGGILSLDDEIDSEREGSSSFEDLLADESDYYEQIDTREMMLQLRSRLTEREQRVLDLLGEDLNQAEIAKRVGTSRANVSRIVAKIRKKLEKHVTF